MSARLLPATVLDLVDTAAIPAGLAVATFLAASPWLHAFAVPATVVVLVIAAIASVSIPSLAIRVWRQPPAVSYAASALGLIVLLVAAAGLHPVAIWHGLTNGPNRLLTETLPLGGSRALLTGPVVLTWLCGTATAELVTRTRRGLPGMAAAGLLLPVACYVLAYAVAASRPGRDELAAPLLLVTLVLVAVSRHVLGLAGAKQAIVGTSVEDEGRPSIWRPGVTGSALAVVVAVVLAVVVPSLPAMSRQPASLNRTAPLATGVLIDPVDAVAAFRDGDPRAPAHTVLDVDTDASSNGYLASAVLDDYDGASWTFDSTFRPTGGRVPAAPAGGAASAGVVGLTTVRQQYAQSAALPLPLLPALDRPVEVSGIDVAADAPTGMLLAGQSTSEATYTVVSRAPLATLATVPPADGVGAAAGASLPATPADLALPAGTSTAMATVLRDLATITGRRPAPTIAFLQAVMTSLHADDRRIDFSLAPVAPPAAPQKKGRAGRPVSTTVPLPVAATTSSGTSLSEVINAVINLRRATPEQFATLYAMVARYLGVPGRLVAGFRVAAGSAAGPVAAGRYQVTNREAWTWVELPVAGLGWVVADPTPDAVTSVSAPRPEAVQATATTLPPPQANAVPGRVITGGHAVAKRASIKVPRSHRTPGWLVALAAVGGVLMVTALLGPGAAGARRVLRRRARRGPDPPQLAVGAWLELLDGLHQAGMPTGRGATSVEVATEAGRHFGPDVTGPVHEVGAVADRAVCSPAWPPDQESAQRAWDTQQSLRQAVHRSLDRRQRARAWLTVGSAPRRPTMDPIPEAGPGRRRRRRIPTRLGSGRGST